MKTHCEEGHLWVFNAGPNDDVVVCDNMLATLKNVDHVEVYGNVRMAITDDKLKSILVHDGASVTLLEHNPERVILHGTGIVELSAWRPWESWIQHEAGPNDEDKARMKATMEPHLQWLKAYLGELYIAKKEGQKEAHNKPIDEMMDIVMADIKKQEEQLQKLK